MADQLKHTSKRGRPKLPESEHTVIQCSHDHQVQHVLWCSHRQMLCQGHQVLCVLQPQTDVMPGPSGILAQGLSMVTSTPGIVHDINVFSTPSVSGVSASETEHTHDIDEPMNVMSGLEEIESSEENTKGISIDITHVDIEGDSDEGMSEEDSDYEPSILISFVLPKELEEKCEDVAFEEAEFGLELTGDEPVEEDHPGEEVILKGISYIKTCDLASSAVKCIRFVSQLKQPAKLKCEKCSTCSSNEVFIEESFSGSAIYLKWVGKEGHVSLRWFMQSLLNRRMHCGDFLTCSTILTTSNNYSKMNLLASMLHTKFPSANQFHFIQGKYLVPTIDSFWSQHQREILGELFRMKKFLS